MFNVKQKRKLNVETAEVFIWETILSDTMKLMPHFAFENKSVE